MNCNTVTFTAADGMETSFPLDFLVEKGAVIANKVNGEDVASVMGATNQLWIPGLPARYFVRDIVGIRFSQEEAVPHLAAFVDDGHDYTNRPNVSVRADYVGQVGCPLSLEGWADDFDREIRAIQFSLDDGKNWTTYETKHADASRWVYWRFSYTPEQSGSYALKVRAVNELGDVSPLPATHTFEVIPSSRK